MSIRSKYFLMFFGLPLAGLGILLLVMSQLFVENKKLDLLDSHLTQLTHVADAVTSRMDAMRMDVMLLASELKTGGPTASRAEDFVMAWRDGVVVAQSGHLSSSAIQKEVTAQTNEPFVYQDGASYHIERSDNLIAAYGFSASLEDNLPKDVTVMRLVDQKSIIVASTAPKEIGKSLETVFPPRDLKSLRDAASSRGSFESAGRDGQLISFTNVRASKLMLLASTPTFSILKASRTFLAQGIGSLFALLGLAALASIYFSNSLGSRFKGLIKVMDAVQLGDFTARAPIGSRDEIGALAVHLNRTAEQLGSLLDSKARAARFDEELKTARIVQDSLFPPAINRFDNATVIGEYQPASEVSGDWWYTFQVGEKIFVLVADVTGHGIAAALMTSAAKACATMVQSRPELTPSQLLKEMNHVLLKTSRGEKQMTMFVLAYDPTNGEVVFSNASHELPYVVDSDGSVEPLMARSGRRLGESLESDYVDEVAQIQEASTIVLFTDGIYDLRNEKDRPLSERNFAKILKSVKSTSTSPETFISTLTARLAGYHVKPQLIDDITLVIFQQH
jgi:serine phosphatase RsbU (regulator of sigma subunit)